LRTCGTRAGRRSVERYALSIADTKFRVACFADAIDAAAWARTLVVDRNDRRTFYSFSFSCDLVHSTQALLEMYRTRTRLPKMVAESVMAIDPLVECVVPSHMLFLENLARVLEERAAEAAALFSRFLFPMPPLSLAEQFDIRRSSRGSRGPCRARSRSVRSCACR
jgi:hypothetical protein